MFKRLWVDRYSFEMKDAYLRYWDIAGAGGILWAFFGDVGLVPDDKLGTGFVLAVRHRGTCLNGFK